MIPWCRPCGQPMHVIERRPDLVRFRCDSCPVTVVQKVEPPAEPEAPRRRKAAGKQVPIGELYGDSPEPAAKRARRKAAKRQTSLRELGG